MRVTKKSDSREYLLKIKLRMRTNTYYLQKQKVCDTPGVDYPVIN